jgi:CRISPR-associated exonuclease Cas4
MTGIKVTGSLVQAYFICNRQVWLMSRQLIGHQEHDFLKIGRLLSGETYKREKKEIQIEGGIIDMVRKKGKELVIIEIKKSAKMLYAGKMQLLFYLQQLKNKGIKASGELRIPKEKKVESITLTPENEEQLAAITGKINDIISLQKPPPAKRIKFCNTCSYAEFCWS